MDSVRRNNEGFAPVQPLLNEIGNAKTIDALHALQTKYAFLNMAFPLVMALEPMKKKPHKTL